MKLLKFSLSSLLFILATGLLSANETIFNGKDLTGWSAEDMSYWSVQDGAIVGTKGDQKIQGNQFLWYDKKVSDFKLTLKVKQVPFAANAGIQFRSMREPNGHAIGYQADIGKGWWGALYHEHGRKILAKNKDTAGKHLNPEKWNKYEILAVGHRIWLANQRKDYRGTSGSNRRTRGTNLLTGARRYATKGYLSRSHFGKESTGQNAWNE
jgi:hypothetical protein